MNADSFFTGSKFIRAPFSIRYFPSATSPFLLPLKRESRGSKTDTDPETDPAIFSALIKFWLKLLKVLNVEFILMLSKVKLPFAI